ncbi:MAG: hypothetical protein KAS58_02045 [Calditrichia bacterium]|jgi:hypothetical protein|nr:hypothetical protein [Calditrichia bacterium]
MKPKIEQTTFGSITIKGEVYEHDVIIRLNGEVKKRKKKLSKFIYGTSHIVSTEEAKYIYEKGAKQIIIGTGQSGMVKLSDEAGNYFKKKRCHVEMLPSQEAIHAWNKVKGSVVSMFHVTC